MSKWQYKKSRILKRLLYSSLLLISVTLNWSPFRMENFICCRISNSRQHFLNPFSLAGMVPTHWYRLVTQNFQILTPTNCVNFARKEVVQCCTTSDENGGNHVTDNRTGLDTLHVSAFLYTCRITSSHHKIEIEYFKLNLILTMSAPVLVIFHLHLVTFHSFALCEKQRII